MANRKQGYRFGVSWIAENDDPASSDAENVEELRGLISVMLLADLFGKEPEDVARDVAKYRARKREHEEDEYQERFGAPASEVKHG